MKKLFLYLSPLLLLISFLNTVFAQLNSGFGNSFNFGGVNNQIMAMKYDTQGNLFIYGKITGKSSFAGQQINPGVDGNNYYKSEFIYGKIDSNGVQTLIRRFGYSAPSAALDKDGNLYIVIPSGTPMQPVDFDNGIINNTYGAKVLKVNNYGSSIWLKPIDFGVGAVYGNPLYELPIISGIQVIENGHIYVAAFGNNLINTSQNLKQPFRIVHLDSSGDEVWHYQITDQNYPIINIPENFVDNDGNVYFKVLSISNSSEKPDIDFNNTSLPSGKGYYKGFLGQSNKGYNYTWLISLNNTGNLNWYYNELDISNFYENTGIPEKTLEIIGLNPVTKKLYTKGQGNFTPSIPIESNQNYAYKGLLVFNNLGSVIQINNITDSIDIENVSFSNNGNMVFKCNNDYNTTLNNIIGNYALLLQTNQNFSNKKFKTIYDRDNGYAFFNLYTDNKYAISVYNDKITMANTFTKSVKFGENTLMPFFNNTPQNSKLYSENDKYDSYIFEFDFKNYINEEYNVWKGFSNNWDEDANWTLGVPTGQSSVLFKTNTNYSPEVSNLPIAATVTVNPNVTTEIPSNLLFKQIVNNGKIIIKGDSFNGNRGNSFFNTNYSGLGEVFFNNLLATTRASCAFYKINKISLNRQVGFKSDSATFTAIDFVGNKAKLYGNITVDNAAPDAITNFNPGSYIIGKLKRKINSHGVYDFPVAYLYNYYPDDKLYSLVTLNLKNILGPTYISASSNFYYAPVFVTENNITYEKSLNSCTWQLLSDTPLISGTYDLSLQARNYTNGVTDLSRYRIFNTNSDVYGILGNTPTTTEIGGDVNNGVVSNGILTSKIEGVTLFNQNFNIFIKDDNTGLPISLVSFKASKINNNVKLSWQTASEINSDFFEIEKSSDGLNFKTLGTLKASGNSSENLFYSIIDFSPALTTNYYRLKQVDLDGVFTYSSILAVNFDLNKNDKISFYPNPANNEIHFAGLTSGATISLLNLEGKSIINQKITNDILQIPSSIKDGVYIIIVKNSDGTKDYLKIAISK
jgi:hypothetical protein